MQFSTEGFDDCSYKWNQSVCVGRVVCVSENRVSPILIAVPWWILDLQQQGTEAETTWQRLGIVQLRIGAGKGRPWNQKESSAIFCGCVRFVERELVTSGRQSPVYFTL